MSWRSDALHLRPIRTLLVEGHRRREWAEYELIEGPASIPLDRHRTLHSQSAKLPTIGADPLQGERRLFRPVVPGVQSDLESRQRTAQ